MTDNNPRPWRDRITIDSMGLWMVDGRKPDLDEYLAAKRGLLDEVHALAAEVERLRAAGSEIAADAEKAWDEVERLRALLATPSDGPLRVERDATANHARPHYLLRNSDVLCSLTEEQADAIEAQLAARPAHDVRPPWYLALDVWMALGLPSEQFDPWAFDDDPRSCWADRWAQLMAAIRGDDLSRDTNPPAGRLVDLLPAIHDLPDGVQPWTAAPIEIDGVPVVGVAMGDVVRGLSDDEWLRTQDRRRWCGIVTNAGASTPAIYLLGRKPTPQPTVTVELPQDVAERYGTERVQVDDHEVVLDSIAKALGR